MENCASFSFKKLADNLGECRVEIEPDVVPPCGGSPPPIQLIDKAGAQYYIPG